MTGDRVRQAAARAAVTASAKTGRPVDPKVAELAATDEVVELTASEAVDAIRALKGLTELVEQLRLNCRAAQRQVDLFMRDGERNRLAVALAVLDMALDADVSSE